MLTKKFLVITSIVGSVLLHIDSGLASTIVKTDPAQIPSFTFKYKGNGGGIIGGASGEGYLLFEKSPLRGVGKESINFEKLLLFNQGNASFEYEYLKYNTNGDITPVIRRDPTLYFDNGYLVGIDLDSENTSISYGECRGFPCEFAGGTVRYSVRGNLSQEFFTGSSQYVADPFSDPVITDFTDYLSGSGTIAFKTIAPIQPTSSVPEPSLTLVGAVMTMVLSAGLKRKFSGSIS